jgi:phenylacetyl-CoA:acceptor oxidoreductase
MVRKMSMEAAQPKSVKHVPSYCYNCVSGPDLMKVKVVDGIATEIAPNFDAEDVHPAKGRVCVKAYGLVQKTYNPNRISTPMKRTNPKKGRNEDPGFVPISWDEALDLVAEKLKAVRAKGLVDEAGLPRVAVSLGHGGTPSNYMGTFPAFLAAWGDVDFSFGSGQGVKCVHSEHLYGEFWHRGFTVAGDTPNCRYNIAVGANVDVTGGPCAVIRHADARVRGYKRVQVEPHLSATGACSAEWVPIRPKTDPAFLFALIHVLVRENGLAKLDIPFLRDRTASPYLVAPDGLYLRDAQSGKPLVWDENTAAAVAHDTPGAKPAVAGSYRVAHAVVVDADKERREYTDVEGATAYEMLARHIEKYSPEWAETVCDVKAATIRRIANEYLDHARIGETVEIEGVTLPFRPVAIALGKTVTNGWGGYECCWARTLIACLVGGLEVPGGTLGTTVRLNRPATSRQASVKMGEDGFMFYPMNPTGKDSWRKDPAVRNAHSTLVPLSANSPWSTALGPTHLAWMFRKESPKNWPKVSAPDVWFCYRTNPSISFWDTQAIVERVAEFPFIVAFAYTRDETNHMADVLLPECTDIESTQLLRVGGTKFMEQFWDHEGYVLRQPAVAPQGQSRDFTDIATELASRTGLLTEYNEAINRGAAGVVLSNHHWDFKLDPQKKHDAASIWDHACRAASAELTDGKETDGLDWYKEKGLRTRPISRLTWYLFPELKKQGIRFEMPFQERLFRIGIELGRRLHENGIDWWDTQLTEYQSLPPCKDFPGVWEKDAAAHGTLADYPFWLVTSRSMQYAWGSNVGIQLMDEVGGNLRGHGGVVINTQRARELGIAEGDLVEVRSYLKSTQGPAILRQGIRPDTLLMIGQFDHWVTPYAKDMKAPSMNGLVPMNLALTDATGSAADLVRVGVKKLEGVA